MTSRALPATDDEHRQVFEAMFAALEELAAATPHLNHAAMIRAKARRLRAIACHDQMRGAKGSCVIEKD